MRWEEPKSIVVPDELRRFVGGHPLVAEHLARLGLTKISAARSFLDPHAYQVTSPFELPDLDRAVERLNRAIKTSEPILIWGDFDIDGQTATALLFSALTRLGANVNYHIPLRDGEGHGVNLPKLGEWISRGIKLIITCDTGITAHRAVDAAASAGVDVLITDHHLLGETLPNALAVVNPMRLPPDHKLRQLPGVGVAYELIAALTSERQSEDLLDLVALGIVGDVAEQKNETRYLLQRGLETMRLTSRPGLLALFDAAGINQLEITETDLGFGLAPRLNAQGRLGDAAESVELLTTNDKARAAELANQLEGMNARRKLESRMVEDAANSMLEREPSLLDYAAITLSHPDWNGGVVGIVANRLAETYRKPVVLLAERDDTAFGSARSVAGVNITEALRACRDLLIKFGGHTMAAGLALRRENLLDFRRKLSRVVREMTPESAAEPTLEIDGYLGLGEISLELVGDLRRLAPFGNGNPPLTLAARDLRIARKKKLGRRGDHLELTVEDANRTRQRVFWWNAGDVEPPAGRFDLAYSLRISHYQDRVEPMLELIDLRRLESEVIEVATAPFEIEDFRNDLNPREKLAELLAQHPDALVWREDDSSIEGRNRTELSQADTLIVWTSPPGPQEWEAALATVNPKKIIIFGQVPPEPSLESFIQRLGGLLKHVVSAKEGEATLDVLAAALAQRADAVRYGLLWFDRTGRLNVDLRKDGDVRITRRDDSAEKTDQPQLEKLIRGVIAETAAYRKHSSLS